MNTNDATTNERTQSSSAGEQARRDDERFWADWWREYAQTWE